VSEAKDVSAARREIESSNGKKARSNIGMHSR
jgi:hypothetical protein